MSSLTRFTAVAGVGPPWSSSTATAKRASTPPAARPSASSCTTPSPPATHRGEQQDVAATLTLVYDHHKTGLTEKLLEAQHKHADPGRGDHARPSGSSPPLPGSHHPARQGRATCRRSPTGLRRPQGHPQGPPRPRDLGRRLTDAPASRPASGRCTRSRGRRSRGRRSRCPALAPAYASRVAPGCSRREPPPALRATPAPAPVEAAGLHNVYRLSDLYSGSGPEGDEGFTSLARLGVRTVISGGRPSRTWPAPQVRPALRPPADRLRRGAAQTRQFAVARAVRDLRGRSICAAPRQTPGGRRRPRCATLPRRVVRGGGGPRLAPHQAGTNPRTRGCTPPARRLRRPTQEELDAVPADFPRGGRGRRSRQADGRGRSTLGPPEPGTRRRLEAAPGPPRHRPAARGVAARRVVRGGFAVASEGQARVEAPGRWLSEAETTAKRLEAVLRAENEKAPMPTRRRRCSSRRRRTARTVTRSIVTRQRNAQQAQAAESSSHGVSRASFRAAAGW